jgi:serine O-acetyltransferase
MNLPDTPIHAIARALSQNTAEASAPVPPPAGSIPAPEAIRRLMEHARAVLFPGFFGPPDTIDHLRALQTLLIDQIRHALPHASAHTPDFPSAEALAHTFLHQLPAIKRLLATDIQAIYTNDPAATSPTEVILCYPALHALTHYRIAHQLFRLHIPLLPRIITEQAHTATGIDIHPGATIGEYFSIDHGTGVVIGETCIIGNHVNLYQGVTLGAKSFTYDPQGIPLNIPRHPIIGDNVVIYSNSTILGRITIGHDSIIGGNVWQAHSVPPYSRIVQHKATTSSFIDGSGI